MFDKLKKLFSKNYLVVIAIVCILLSIVYLVISFKDKIFKVKEDKKFGDIVVENDSFTQQVNLSDTKIFIANDADVEKLDTVNKVYNVTDWTTDVNFTSVAMNLGLEETNNPKFRVWKGAIGEMGIYKSHYEIRISSSNNAKLNPDNLKSNSTAAMVSFLKDIFGVNKWDKFKFDYELKNDTLLVVGYITLDGKDVMLENWSRELIQAVFDKNGYLNYLRIYRFFPLDDTYGTYRGFSKDSLVKGLNNETNFNKIVNSRIIWDEYTTSRTGNEDILDNYTVSFTDMTINAINIKSIKNGYFIDVESMKLVPIIMINCYMSINKTLDLKAGVYTTEFWLVNLE